MARNKKQQPTNANGFLLFDVLYEDGARSSNRKVPSAEAEGLDGEEAIRAYIEAQDAKIAEMSGKPRGPIKSITPAAGK